jgi:transcriptional/translational regulatory protein YebC/TACO1
MFERKGQIVLDAARYHEDVALEAALEAGAEDLQRDGDQLVITTDPHGFHAVAEALQRRGIEPQSSEVAMLPKSTVRVAGSDAERLLKLMEAVEEHDDVSKVHSNFDIDAETLAAVGG